MSLERHSRAHQNRRKYTATPGYYGVLPRVFPYKKKCSLDFALGLLQAIQQLEPEAITGVAITTHPSDGYGVVTMWFSSTLGDYIESHAIARIEASDD